MRTESGRHATAASGGPLAGCRIAVTRARDQADSLVALLEARGAVPLACATIATEPPESYAPLDDAIRSLEAYAWVVFTSANGVAAFAARIAALGAPMPAAIRVAAVGAATARACAARLRSADFVPTSASAGALAEQLDGVAGRRVLWVRGSLAGPALADGLRARGARVDEVVGYRTVGGDGARELAQLLRAGGVDAILFMSGSSVRHLLEALETLDSDEADVALRGPGRAAVVCIGPATAHAARQAGLEVDSVADDKSDAGIVDAVERWFAARNAKVEH